mgnify:CR=1 FL=1
MQENYLSQGGVIPRRWRHAKRYLAQLVVLTQRIPAPAYNAVGVSRDRAGLQRRGRLSRPRRLTTPQTTRPSALAASSRVRARLQQRGQLARPHRLTTPRPAHMSAPAAGSAVIDFSFT